MSDIEKIREHHAEVTDRTPGPWRWGGHERHGMYLFTVSHGRQVVMAFQRLGMQGAEPMFPDPDRNDGLGWIKPARDLVVRETAYRTDIADIDNPHARYLARSVEYIGALLAEVDRLRSKVGEDA